MALTKFVTGKFNAFNSVSRLVDYITNPEKTTPDLISSNCGTADPQEVVDRMMATKRMWEKTGGVQLFHDVVALAPGEGTPEDMLKFAQKYAYAKYGKDYEYIIAVHTNKDHLHAHIVANSVSLTTGKKFTSRPETLKRMRGVTDSLCKEFGYSITEKGKHYDGSLFDKEEVTAFNRASYEQTKKGSSWLKNIYSNVRDAARTSNSYDEFVANLNKRGVTIKETKSHLTYIDAAGHRVRDTRICDVFHRDYSKDRLEKVFAYKKSQREAPVKVYKFEVGRSDYVRCQLAMIRKAKKLGSFFWYNDDPVSQTIAIMTTSLALLNELMELMVRLYELANPVEKPSMLVEKSVVESYRRAFTKGIEHLDFRTSSGGREYIGYDREDRER